jgi:tetratricopeptide (TPR) repeat protein
LGVSGGRDQLGSPPGAALESGLEGSRESGPEDALVLAFAHRAGLLLRQGKYAEAIRDYEESIRLGYIGAVNYYNGGIAYYALGRLEEALESYSRSLELEASEPDALYNRGLAYRDLSRPSEAIADFSAVLAANPRDASARFQRGICLLRVNRRREALADLLVYLELGEDSDRLGQARRLVGELGAGGTEGGAESLRGGGSC